SLEPGTAAVKLDGHLPEDVKFARRDALMAAQQEIAFQWGESLVGYELDCLIDGPTDEPDQWVGRIFADAPEIDGVVYVQGTNLQPGQMVPVEILEASDYDLIAEVSSGDETEDDDA
ncbi:MAG: TRAM domain-containing protein, partial [Planctomycetaceae bacterium]|nr:TRAM domain-containing protein [Planctomycetaceae bacterium]